MILWKLVGLIMVCVIYFGAFTSLGDAITHYQVVPYDVILPEPPKETKKEPDGETPADSTPS